MINSRLKVLIKESFELLILLVEQSCLLNQILSLNQQGVILGQSLVQGSPNTEAFVREDLGHPFPEDFLLSLLSLLLLLFGLEVRLLLQSWVANQILVVQLLLTFEVELL